MPNPIPELQAAIAHGRWRTYNNHVLVFLFCMETTHGHASLNGEYVDHVAEYFGMLFDIESGEF